MIKRAVCAELDVSDMKKSFLVLYKERWEIMSASQENSLVALLWFHICERQRLPLNHRARVPSLFPGFSPPMSAEASQRGDEAWDAADQESNGRAEERGHTAREQIPHWHPTRVL
jgi:hypothetical protein